MPQTKRQTSAAFTGLLLENKIAISYGWARRLAGQRLCRAALAVGQVRGGHLRAYTSVAEARASLGRYLNSITRYAPIRALTRERRITPTLTICHTQRQ